MPRHPVLTDAALDAALGPEAAPDLQASSPRFFHNPRLERLTRAHWASPYAIYLPVVALILLSLRTSHFSRPALLALLGAGWLVWTLVEYWLHRGLFHLRPATPARRVTSFIVHRHHHLAPGDRTRLVATPAQSGLLALLLLGLYTLLAGPDARWALLAGSLLGYLAYEFAHYSAHHRRPRTRLGRALRRRHLRHHFKHPEAGFGISTPLWDALFRTCPSEHAPKSMPQ